MATTTDPNGGVAAEVRALLGRHRDTQAHLAHVLGIAQPTLSRKLNGEVQFSIPQLKTIADHYKVPLSSLFPDDPPPRAIA